MKIRTQKVIMVAMLSSLACVATMLIKIPSPMKGYINLGDGVVLIAGWMLGPGYGFLAAGLGSALADVLYGFAPSAINIPADAVQALAGLILGMVLIKSFDKMKM